MRRAAWLAVTLGVVACGGTPGQAGSGPVREPMIVDLPGGRAWVMDLVRDDETTTALIAAAPDAVWRHVPAVYGVIGLGPESWSLLDPGARQIAVQNHRVRRLAGERLSRFLRCGGGLGSPKADRGETQVGLATWLEPAEGGTLLHTRLVGTARGGGASTGVIRCTSTGELERILTEQVAARAAGGGD